MGVKRWLLVLGLGTAVSSLAIINLLLLFKRQAWLPTSVYNALTLQFLPVPLQIILPLLLGGLLILWGVLQIGRNLTAPFREDEHNVAERIYEHSRHRRGPHIVAIGGGTGMPSLLRGLTAYTRNITAIVHDTPNQG